MSSMEKLIPCSAERGESPPNRDTSIVFVAFFIFSIACVMFVSYIAVDHSLELAKLEADIDKMEKELQSLKTTQTSSIHGGNHGLNKVVSAMLEAERRCDPAFAVIQQIGEQIKGKQSECLTMWDAMPMAFMHLVGKKVFPKASQENVDGMETVVGWEIEGGGTCTEADPSTDGSDIFIPRDGNYSVYSQITFYSNSMDPPIVHRHVIQYVETFANVRDDPKILLENDYQISDGASRVSYQSGVYRFNKGDELRVLVKKGKNTVFHKEGEEKGVEASFGVYLL